MKRGWNVKWLGFSMLAASLALLVTFNVVWCEPAFATSVLSAACLIGATAAAVCSTAIFWSRPGDAWYLTVPRILVGLYAAMVALLSVLLLIAPVACW